MPRRREPSDFARARCSEGRRSTDTVDMYQQQGLFAPDAPDPKRYSTLEFDGACEPNPGMMQIGFVIRDPAWRTVSEISRKLGHGTNNIAEYQALIHGLRAALDLGIADLRVQ